MPAYWFTFTDRSPACAYVPHPQAEAEARALAEEHGTVKTMQPIGYPARPRLDELDGWDHSKGQCPSFCTDPKLCAAAGGSCVNPRGRSCTS